MPERIIKQPISVMRNNVTVTPAIGKVFTLTDAEVKEINALNPAALGHVILAVAAEPMPAAAVAVEAKK